MTTTLPSLEIEPATLLAIQQEYLARVQGLMLHPENISAPTDKRFSGASWAALPWSGTAAIFDLNREFMLKMVNQIKGEPLAVERIKFFAEQAIDAMSPSNFFATNPEAQLHMLETSGKSLQDGLSNLMNDIQQGRLSQSDESKFVVGENLGITPGKVVFRNELIELICYTPSTVKVYQRPILMIPPCINKFYILDLQPENSLVRHMVGLGHQVFMVSWRNVQEDQGLLTWDDYLEMGVMQAITTVQKLTAQKTINALGFCVGGTLLSSALAALAARGENPIESLTLLTTLLDFSQPGVLGLFIDEENCAQREATLATAKGGVMHGKELATTFSFLRPNDLVWNYVVNNYLKGETPAAFDLLFWNSDSTNLPGPMFTWYLRHMYLQNELIQPSKLMGAGEPLDLGSITCPAFIYGSREDHIVPWQGAYSSTSLLGGPTKFVLGASGHIAGVINPAQKNKRNYWRSAHSRQPKNKGKRTQIPSAQSWFDSAETVPGSWWNEWGPWLAEHAGKQIASATLTTKKTRSLGSAPGSYVKQRA
jgi:polyhydroxyalkanoate synthase subunit PhaC